MRILLDECVDTRLRNYFGGHAAVTAKYAGFSGLKNGRLLSRAEAAGFDVIVTVDQHIHDQQNLRERVISIMVLCAVSNRLSDLLPLIPAMALALETIKAGEVITIS